MNKSTTEYLCPICQAENNCQVNSEQPCWCMKVNVPSIVIEQVASSQKGKACICLACIEKNKLSEK